MYPHESSQWAVLEFKNELCMLQQEEREKEGEILYWIYSNSVWLLIYLLDEYLENSMYTCNKITFTGYTSQTINLP